MKINVISCNMAMGKSDKKRKEIPNMIGRKSTAFDIFVDEFVRQYDEDPQALWLICVQEINRSDKEYMNFSVRIGENQVEEMKDNLTKITSVKWYGHQVTRKGGNLIWQKEAVAIFSNYPCLGEKQSEHLPGKRAGLILEFEIAPGKKIGVATIHFIAPGEDTDGSLRISSMSQILDAINDRFTDKNEPVILCGDFNVFDTSPSADGLPIYSEPKDADPVYIFDNTIGMALNANPPFQRAAVSPFAPTQANITYHAWNYPDLPATGVSWGIFDYILVRLGECTLGTPTIVNFSAESGGKTQYASDHKGVLLSLEYTMDNKGIDWDTETSFPADSAGFDEDSVSAVAVNNKNHVVEVHSNGSGEHYYMVGFLRSNDDPAYPGSGRIVWNVPHDPYETGSGTIMSVALDNNDNVVVVHTNQDGNQHYYSVGQLIIDPADRSKSSWQIIWKNHGSCSQGSEVAIAMDDKHNIVEVHKGNEGSKHEDELSATIGKSSGDETDPAITSIEWKDGGDHYDTGRHPSVAMDEDLNVVEVHRGYDHEYRHYCRSGMLDVEKRTIHWKWDNDGDYYGSKDVGELAVAMDKYRNIVEIHSLSDSTDLHYIIGSLDNETYVITWEYASTDTFAQGSKISLAITNGLEIIAVYFKSGSTIPYYITGRLIKDSNNAESTSACAGMEGRP